MNTAKQFLLPSTVNANFDLSIALLGDARIVTGTRVDTDDGKPSGRFANCQSMLGPIHEQLTEKSAIPLPMQGSVS